MRVFDGHCDTISHCFETGEHFADSSGHWTIEKVRTFTSYAQFFAVFGDQAKYLGTSMFPLFLEQEALFRRELAAHGKDMAFCVDWAGCERAWAEGKVAAFLSVEGAELLDCSQEGLRKAYAMGVRAVNLTWNHPNVLSGTNAADVGRGLSDRGRSFVREMNRLGMLVDVSHLSDPGFWDVVDVTTSPVIASHSDSRACHFHTRNLTDAQFTAIINLQGAVGLNLCVDFLGQGATVDTVVRHLEHFLDLGGEDTVALGGDWDGIDQMPREIEDVRGWAVLYRRLEELGYGAELLDKLFYKNLMRVVKRVCIM